MARAKKTCPKCAADVGRVDTVCVECGCPLVVDEEEDTRLGPGTSAHGYGAASVNPASAGVASAGETSEETRLRVFDKQLSEELRKSLPAIIVATVISLLVGLVLTSVARDMLQQLGGFSALGDIDWGALRAKRLGMLWDPAVVFVMTGGLSLAGYLCGVGELLRFITARRAISAVKAGQVPDVVALTALTRVGLLVVAAVLPPLGIVLGIVFKLTKSTDLKDLGGQMVYLSLLVAAVVVVAVLWDMMAEIAGRHKPVSSVH